MKKFLRILWILVVLAWAFLVILKTTTRFTPAQPTTTLANPASVYCEQQSGTLEIVTDASGAQLGICHLTGWVDCEEWAYFRGECPTTGSEITWAVENSWLTDQNNQTTTYTSSEYGFSLQYPSIREIQKWEDINTAHQDFTPMVSQTRFYDKDSNIPLGIVIYNTIYSSFKNFTSWHNTPVAGNVLVSTKETTIGKYIFVETIETDGIDSKGIYFYIVHNNYTLVFRCDNNATSRKTLVEILSTLMLTK